MPQSGLLTAQQVAQRLNISLRSAQRLMLNELETVNVSTGCTQKSRRVQPAVLERWITARTEQPAAAPPKLRVVKPRKRRKPGGCNLYPQPVNGKIPGR